MQSMGILVFGCLEMAGDPVGAMIAWAPARAMLRSNFRFGASASSSCIQYIIYIKGNARGKVFVFTGSGNGFAEIAQRHSCARQERTSVSRAVVDWKEAPGSCVLVVE